MNISDVIAGIHWIDNGIAIIISMVTAIWSIWKFHKQQELSMTLQEKQEKAQKELETYKNELKQQNEKIKHLNEMQMANYTLFAQKKNETCIALFEALNQALECLASSASLLHQDNTFEDFDESDIRNFLAEIGLTHGKKKELLALWKNDSIAAIKKLRYLQRKNRDIKAVNAITEAATIFRRTQLYLTQALVNDIQSFIDDCASFANGIKAHNELMERGIFDQPGEVTDRPKKMNELWDRMDKITVELKEELKNCES